VCREHADKSDLIRLVLTPDGVKIDREGKMDGRGAYVHKNVACIGNCIKKFSLNSAFKGAVSKDVYDELKNEL
jgi:predicted RNA-binding protein YlxR (DUF448 family)